MLLKTHGQEGLFTMLNHLNLANSYNYETVRYVINPYSELAESRAMRMRFHPLFGEYKTQKLFIQHHNIIFFNKLEYKTHCR